MYPVVIIALVTLAVFAMIKDIVRGDLLALRVNCGVAVLALITIEVIHYVNS